jgi:hypothetical protein
MLRKGVAYLAYLAYLVQGKAGPTPGLASRPLPRWGAATARVNKCGSAELVLVPLWLWKRGTGTRKGKGARRGSLVPPRGE